MEFELNDNEIFLESIREIDICMITTLSKDGSLHSRPMMKLEIPLNKFTDRMLWFFSKKDSSLNNEIKKDENVNLTFIHPSYKQFISVSGKASIHEDKSLMLSYWSEKLQTWFPEGPNDPELSLIGIKVETADIWNSPAGKMLKIMRIIFSSITRKSYSTSQGAIHLELRE